VREPQEAQLTVVSLDILFRPGTEKARPKLLRPRHRFAQQRSLYIVRRMMDL